MWNICRKDIYASIFWSGMHIFRDTRSCCVQEFMYRVAAIGFGACSDIQHILHDVLYSQGTSSPWIGDKIQLRNTHRLRCSLVISRQLIPLVSHDAVNADGGHYSLYGALY